MSLATSYRIIAPFYDLLVARALAPARRASLSHIGMKRQLSVLLDGVGTGLDFAYLPPWHRYVGIDLVEPMLGRCARRVRDFDCALLRGNSCALPFAAERFDVVVLHLILAIVPTPSRALAEAARVTRPGGTLLVLDKFLRRGQRAPVRRALSPLVARVATRLDVEFEAILADVPALRVERDEPAMAGGWFRRIVLRRTGA